MSNFDELASALGWTPMPSGLRIVQEMSSGDIILTADPPTVRMTQAETRTLIAALSGHVSSTKEAP